MKHRLPVVLAAAAALVAVGAAPALAATGGPSDTTATFTLGGGDLTLTAAATASLTNATSGSTDISGTLGAVHVTDNRGTETAWSVSASSSQFVGTGSNPSSSTAVTYRGGVPSTTGTITFGATGAHLNTANVNAGGVVVAPDSIYGNNTATWNPTIHVAMPTNALADTYSATVTTSIL